ncbi:hypothetical protein [Novosphingobium sp. B1]|uniref:hypothetical protein n=1 Tax=Novosphingobium sp. B1 TaxID=1938756 RepID=UPI0009D8BA55|nr:hypothetical protein [Novosphingobium sp. B1]SMD06871.1 hypothetical protein SAMN06272759_1335 [Novosphingobium sp. B1]
MLGFWRLLSAMVLLWPALCGHAAKAQSRPPASETAQPPSGSVGGLGDINLYPKRLVLTDRDRVGAIGLYNRSTATGEYEITIDDKVMLPDGNIVELDALGSNSVPSDYKPASAMIRYSPRMVELPGNESQTVRIMPKLAPGMQPGEYRTHFTVTALPPLDSPDSINNLGGARSNEGIGVQILPRFGISIPVILRIGQTSLHCALKELKLEKTSDTEAMLVITLSREGNRSSFGDVVVSAPGVSKPVAVLRGVGIYTEVQSRTVQLPITLKREGSVLKSGSTLTVSYVDDDVKPGDVLAKQDIRIP